MTQTDNLNYKMYHTKGMSFFVGGLILLITGILCVWIMVNPIPMGWLVIFLAIFMVNCFLWGGYLLLFPFFTVLSIDNEGISYARPCYSVFAKWTDVQSIEITEEALVLVFGMEANVRRKFPANILCHQKRVNIPLHYFVKKWSNQEDWENNKILKEITKDRMIEISGID